MKCKVAIVELAASHDECILSQLVALKSNNCHITLVTIQEIADRNPGFKEFVDELHLIEFTGRALADFKLMRTLNRYFKEKMIQKVILNTAQGGHIRNLCLSASKKVEFYGIIHTIRKFQGSFTHRLINLKVKKYFVLNDYFLDKINPTYRKKVYSFYPLRFPHFSTDVKKPAGQIWITIIGGVENRRKDLLGSLELMRQTPDNIRFIFLGKSDPNHDEVEQLRKRLSELELTEKVVLFDKFVPADIFDAYLRITDLIWPMVHPETPSAKEYFRNQISGAMNVSFGYHIPMLVHESYKQSWQDLQYSFAYTQETFKKDIESAIINLDHYKVSLMKEPKFKAEFQEDNYLKVLFP
jgi:hypothetical protein